MAPQRFFPAGTEPLHAEEQMMNAPRHAEMNFLSHMDTLHIINSSVITTKHFIDSSEKLHNLNSGAWNQKYDIHSTPTLKSYEFSELGGLKHGN